MKEPNPNANDIGQRSSLPTDDGTPPTPPPGPNLADTDPEPDKPAIRVAPGELHLNRADAEKVLADTGAYFTSGSGLVRIIKKAGGGVAVELVNEQTLRTFLSASINWERKGRDNLWLRCDPPQSIVKALLFGQDRHHLQPLNGIARQPHFGDDGRLITTPGYDPTTGVFGVFDPADYRLNEPSREEAQHGLDYLDFLLDEFEFETEADRSAALSAIFTAVMRPSLTVAPAFNITATTSGSGKSYLADVVALFAGPDEPYRVGYPSGADEAGKLIVTVLNEKPATVVFDDMQTNWKPYGAVNRMLTSPTTTERMLGTNRSATVTTRALFIGTGNNIEPERDLRRRVVSIRLAPRHETPALRSFRNDPVALMSKNRAQAVSSVLAIVSAFRAAGEPVQKARAIATYGEWSQSCRQPILWMDRPDPAQSLIDQLSHDPDRQALSAFLDAWFDCFGTKAVTVRQIIAKAEEKPLLMEALEDLPIMDGRYINRGKLGWFISKNRGRRVDQLRIEAGDSSERRSWKIAV